MSNAPAPEVIRVDSSIGEHRPPTEATIHGPSDLAKMREDWAEQAAIPVLIARREDGIDNSWGNLDIRTILRGEHTEGQFAVHSIVLQPGASIDRHYLTDTHSFLLVADGELEMSVGGHTETVGKHSLGYAPPQTHQSLTNNSTSAAMIAVIHSPAGTDQAFAAARKHATTTAAPGGIHDVLERYGFRFTPDALENDALTNTAPAPVEVDIEGPGDLERLREAFAQRPGIPQLIRTTPDEYDAVSAGETRRKELINGDLTGGHAMLNMLSGLPGFGAPVHHQFSEEEFFFVTGGELEVTCGAETAVVGAGALAFCPRNCSHGFTNKSTEQTTFVTLNSPAGHERSMAAVRKATMRGDSKESRYQLAADGGFVFRSPDVLG